MRVTSLPAAARRWAVLSCAALAALAARAAAPPALGAQSTPAGEASAAGAEGAVPARAIEGFAFDNVMRMGVGGFLATTVVPVVLFRDGSALTDVKGLAFPGGLAAYRQREPDDWTTWRRSGDRIELLRTPKRGPAAWKALPFRSFYTTLPRDFRLDGTYRSLGGTGDVALGGATSVAGWRDLRFFADGRFEGGGGSGGSVSGGGGTTVFSGTAAARRGRYRIDGLELVLAYDDGPTERRIIVTDPASPTVIWLDGRGYTRPRAAR